MQSFPEFRTLITRTFFLVLLLFSTSSAYPQSYYGSLRGLVTDAAGGAVANVSVTIIDTTTDISRTVATNSDGLYVFSSLEPSRYHLIAQGAGFKKIEHKQISVGTQQVITLDLKLEVGSVSQIVEVSATEPLINTSNASNGQVFDTQKLQDLPNLGRNPFLFSKLNTNVTPVGDPRFNRFQDQSGSSQISIAGGPIRANNYLVDGVPITDLQNRAVIIPSLEAVQEVKLQANTYDAEMGRTGGGVFNTLLKSGSNALHGGLYGATRQTDWAANTYFNNRNKIARGDSTFYSYAGWMGGPIWIPKIYKGKDRTFFWLTEEGYRQRSPLSGSYYIPSALERAGDFSKTVTKAGAPLVIYDPRTSVNVGGKITRTPFPNNAIPADRISSIGKALLGFIPTNTNSTAAGYGATNLVQTDLLGDRADEFNGKIDHQFTHWWLANASYMHYGSKEPGGNPLGSPAGTNGVSYLLYRKVDAVSVNNTVSINPTTVATIGFGFNRFPNNTVDLSTGFNQGQLGFPSAYVASLQKAAIPAVSMQSAASFGTNNSGPAVFYSRSFVAGLSKSMGRHNVKTGYVFRSISVDFTDISYGNGQYSFDSSFTSADGSASTSSGSDVADLLLGLPTSGQVNVASKLALNVRYDAGFLQDDFRINRKLTLNTGLRYEYESGVKDRNNKFAVGFDRTVTNPISNTSGVATKGGVMFAGQNGYSSNCCNNSATKIAPRLGFVYAPMEKLVLRGGYGVFYAPLYYSASSSLAPGFTQTNTYIASNDGNATPANSIANPFPSGLQSPSGNGKGYLTGLGSSVTVLDQYRRSPLVQQYSFDIEKEFPCGLAFQLGYVGAKGRNLQPSTTGLGTININQLSAAQFSLGAALSASVANPYYQKGGTGVIGSSTVAYNQLLRPFPEFSAVNILTSSAYSRYDSMILKVQKHLSHGVTFLSTYTWASNWDSTWGTTSSINSGASSPQNIYNLKGEYARSISDISNRFTFGGSYELPLGKGKPFLHGNRFLDLAVGGWAINAMGILQGGAPLAVYQNTNGNSRLGTVLQRPNLTGISPCYSGSPQDRLNSYLNPAAFSTAADYTFGNSPRTLPCRGPGYANWDMSLFKNFKAERVNFQFRAEALNAFNTPQFQSPVVALGNSNFGKIQSTVNFPRYIQLGGRISF